MLSTLLEASRNSIFKSPFTRVQCESPAPSREVQAAAAAPASDESCEFGSSKYFLLCGIGGILSCGTTHTFVVPLDLVKCRLQVDQAKYKNLFNGFKVSVNEEGMRGLAKGWAPTFFGYSAQITHFSQAIQLSLMCPEKRPKSLRSFMNISFIPKCNILKVVLHDIYLLYHSFAVLTNVVFLYDVAMGNYTSLMTYLIVSFITLCVRLLVSVTTYTVSSPWMTSGDFIYQIMSLFILFFNWSEVVCIIYNRYESCIFPEVDYIK